MNMHDWKIIQPLWKPFYSGDFLLFDLEPGEKAGQRHPGNFELINLLKIAVDPSRKLH